MPSLVLVTSLLCPAVLPSINIATLPPDLRRLDLLANLPARSTINPVWRGDHHAALDGEQNRVRVSWSVMEESVEFQVQ